MSVEYVIGDCREVLKTLPDNSINCCVTSPPYYNLRDYNHPNQIGIEHTPDEYVNELVQVFREVRRVLRDDGTVWLNLGDSYNGSGGNHKAHHKNDTGFQGKVGERCGGTGAKVHTLKPKDLIGIPWRVAFALQADGWYLRQDIIWAKPNPMPESVKDRCTKSHEYVFLLSKNEKYYYDYTAIKETASSIHHGDKVGGKKYTDAGYQNGPGYFSNGFKNKRSVWTISTKPYKGAHFAVFPQELAEPCILAGCPVGGTVLDPFGGSGTVGEVCRLHQRNAILIELNPEYEPLIKERIGVNIPELTSFEVVL